MIQTIINICHIKWDSDIINTSQPTYDRIKFIGQYQGGYIFNKCDNDDVHFNIFELNCYPLKIIDDIGSDLDNDMYDLLDSMKIIETFKELLLSVDLIICNEFGIYKQNVISVKNLLIYYFPEIVIYNNYVNLKTLISNNYIQNKSSEFIKIINFLNKKSYADLQFQIMESCAWNSDLVFALNEYVNILNDNFSVVVDKYKIDFKYYNSYVTIRLYDEDIIYSKSIDNYQ